MVWWANLRAKWGFYHYDRVIKMLCASTQNTLIMMPIFSQVLPVPYRVFLEVKPSITNNKCTQDSSWCHCTSNCFYQEKTGSWHTGKNRHQAKSLRNRVREGHRNLSDHPGEKGPELWWRINAGHVTVSDYDFAYEVHAGGLGILSLNELPGLLFF